MDTNGTEMAHAEYESLHQQLTQCQAALTLKDEALNYAVKQVPELSDVPRIEKALAIKPDNAALREWGARMLETLANGRDRIGVVGMLPFELRQSANYLRSGEWTPEVLK